MKKYVIQKGDSFSSLAQQFGIKNGDILKTYHNLHCPEEDIMQEPIPGKEIIIPEDPKLMIEDNNVPSFSSTAYKEGEITETEAHEKSSSEKPSSEIEPSEQEEKKDENEEGSSNPHEGKYFVIQKGMCQCNQGFKFPKFKVTSHQKHYWNDENGQADYLAVTEDDLTFDPVAMPFGKCKLRPSLGGYLPCTYSPAGKWQKIYEKVKVMGKSCVTEISELMCCTGGKITILKHGQQSEIGKSHVRNADSREQQIYNPVVNFDAFKAEIEENESEFSVQPQKDETSPKEKEILEVRLTFDDGTPVNKKLSYRDRLWARAKCQGLEGEHIIFTLWEDDERGAGHNTKNQFIIKSPPIEVDSMGYARWNFTLLNTFIKLANLREDDKKQHEYYVTAEYNGKIRASDNANANNPEYHISITSKPNTRKSKPENFPQPQPHPDSAKGSTHQGSKNNQPDKKGIITKVRLTDKNGKEFTKRPKFGERIKLVIEGKELVGKSYQLKIWEHDTLGSNDLLYSNRHTFGGNRQEVLITLTDEMQKTGEFGNDKKIPDFGEYWTGRYQEIFAEVIFLYKSAQSQVIEVDLNTEPKKPENTRSPAIVGPSPKTQKKENKKEKFEKVVGLGKEAVIYVTNEIATPINVDKNGNLVFYPDYGAYNGMTEYKEGDKLYCKKISATKSAFPLYKMYIYRGNKEGEAVQKLKQDIENKTHENAESTVLTIARHAQSNNKNYGKSGPLPPNTINKLYRIRYMQAWNHANKESFRYRIVGDNTSNMKPVNDLKKEVSSGAMTLGSRGSISIDPWKSKDLIGCIGIRNSDGSNHSSCTDRMTSQNIKSITEYKYIYHALNNYLETIIPELTGVYGRRGYSSNGKVVVKASEYKEEIKVFVLVDPLPELNKNEK